MPLTGENKKACQREYIRRKRMGLTGSNVVRAAKTNKSDMVEPGGFEPPTFAMRTQRSPE